MIPSGTVTFLFTDIEGSTRMWELFPEKMSAALARHNEILSSTIESEEGFVFRTVGDAYCSAFARADSAVRAALQIQHRLLSEVWDPDTVIKVRIGIHTGLTEYRDGDYWGQPLNRVARVQSTAHGGQTVLSGTSRDLVADQVPEGAFLINLGVHRLRDLERPVQIWQLMCEGLPAKFPPLKTLREDLHNLPEQTTTFVGRSEELSKIRQLLDTGRRLVTLVGFGGSGKTRLALHVAAESLHKYVDGAWLIEVAQAQTIDDVIRQMLAVFGLREESGVSAEETLLSRLRSLSTLILLDNSENLATHLRAPLKRWVQACPSIKILATSRTPIEVQGEQTFPLDPFPIPEVGATASIARLAASPSVALFVDRAQLAEPEFVLTSENVGAVAAICRRTDGIPLAIELVAPRVRSMTPIEMANRLDQLFGGRGAGETLRELFLWSYELLDRAEQDLLRRLSVFRGGWTLDAAEKVCPSTAPADFDSVDVWDLLEGLVSKALVIHSQTGARGRYRVLDPVRRYSSELSDEAELHGAQERHAVHFLHWSEEEGRLLEEGGDGTSKTSILDEIEVEHDNLRAAVETLEMPRYDPELALRLASSLVRFWEIRGFYTEGRTLLQGALHRAGPPSAVRANALNALANLARAQGDLAFARSTYVEALEIRRSLDDAAGIARILNNLGTIAFYEGNLEEAKTLANEAIAVYEALEDDRVIGLMLLSLGNIEDSLGNLVLAGDCFRRSSAIATQLNDDHLGLYALPNLGLNAAKQGLFDEACQTYQVSLMVCLRMRARNVAGDVFRYLAQAELSTNKLVVAALHYGTASGIRDELGVRLSALDQAEHDADLAKLRNHLGEVAFGDAFEAGRQMGWAEAIALLEEPGQNGPN